MSSHPGCDLEDAVELAEYIRDMGFIPEQAQDFYPTPSTLSTCMYYTGLDPRTMDPVYVPKSPHEKAMQRALIQYRNPENYELVCRGTAPDTPGGSDRIRTEMSRTTEKDGRGGRKTVKRKRVQRKRLWPEDGE